MKFAELAGRPVWLPGVLRLTRWDEHLLFTVPATVLGVNLAAAGEGAPALSGRTLAVLVANLLAVTFAFMVNDIEDADDDCRDAARRARNAVASGLLAPRDGWIAAGGVGLAALVAYTQAGSAACGVGLLILVLGVLYSWRAVRLKALPVVDVIAHLLMLSALLFLAGYMAAGHDPARVWAAAAGVGLISAYGQVYNQVRDYDQDRAAGLHNTTRLLGLRRARWLMYGSLGAAGVCLAISILGGLWPLWLAAIPVGALPLALALRSSTDMRGTAAIDASGRWQLAAMLVANVTVLLWWLALVVG